MIKKGIKLGYEVGTGEEVYIQPAHLVVTGITQESGKTTALLALIKRGKFKAIIFRTKIGEKSITEGTIIPPYYKDEFDWEYASEILEASRKEKLKFERSWIIKYSKTAKNLLEFKTNIDNALANEKLRELEKSVLITLQAYLEKILPELQYAPLSNTLDLQDDINIMDLERFKEETQGLIIRSVLTEVLKHYKNTVVVIPEGWRYIPEGFGSPVKRPAEAFIRQGATNNNFLFLDSQDITGISKTILKQVSNWCLGYQREINEIKRTLDQIPLPRKQKPKPEDIASLQVGHFFVATSQFCKKCYVQPVWLDSQTAREIALGKKKIKDIEQPLSIAPHSLQVSTQQKPASSHPLTEKASPDLTPIKKEIIELRNDFFSKIQEQQQAITTIHSELFKLKNQPKQEIDTDEIVSLVLQKMPLNNSAPVNEESIVSKVLARVPKTPGATIYEVAPLEKIKKDFLEECKNKILADIEQLSPDEKKVLKYLESVNRDISPSEIITKCLLLKVGGSQSAKVSVILKSLRSIEVAEKTAGGRNKGILKQRIQGLLANHEASDQEIEQIYSHILMEML